MYYHVVLGGKISTLLLSYFKDSGFESDHQIITLLDDLSFGPLRDDSLPFSDLRNSYWESLKPNEKDKKSIQITDLEQLLELRSKMIQNESIKLVFWHDNTANSILYYYLIIHYFKHLSERLFTINTLNLPFLDDQLRLFYPNHLYQIPYKELRKVLKLLRPISKPEIDADLDEFATYQAERVNTYRVLAKGKTILSLSYDEIGKLLLDNITSDSSKVKKVVSDWLSGADSIFAPVFYNYFIDDLSIKGFISIENNTITKM